MLADEYGSTMRRLFLAGFWATSSASVVGVWNGGSLLVGDFAVTVRAEPASDLAAGLEEPRRPRARGFAATSGG